MEVFLKNNNIHEKLGGMLAIKVLKKDKLINIIQGIQEKDFDEEQFVKIMEWVFDNFGDIYYKKHDRYECFEKGEVYNGENLVFNEI